jgi:succinate dehydrogenase / fumarate reductase, membrane anchor subunit
MSVTIEVPNSPRSRKAANWEKYGWVYMRISGPLLVVLIFVHLISNLVVPDGGIKAIDFAFVAGKWAAPFWQWWDLAMLWLAMLHGTNGMRTVINDYTEHEGVRKTLVFSLWGVCAALIVLGTLVIFTFDPCPAGSPLDLLPSFCPAVTQ